MAANPQFFSQAAQAARVMGFWQKRALVLAVAGAMMAGCGAQGDKGPGAPPPAAVTVMQVQQGDVVDWDSYSGRFESVQQVELRPRVSGYVDRMAVAEGQRVRKGELLFQIDPRPYQAEADRTAAEVARCRAALELADSELARADKLVAAHAESREEYEQRQSTRAQAQADLAAAQAAQENAQLNLGFTRVTAPIDGRVSRGDVTAGNYVTAGQTVLTRIVSVDPMYVYFDADEQTYLRYTQGHGTSAAEAAIGLANEDGYPHAGHVDFFDNALNPDSGTIRARVVVPNPDGRLVPGLFARVHLSDAGAQPAVLVDDRAISTDQDRRYVLVVDDKNTVGYRTVTLGDVAPNGLRVIRSGLKAGETVIVAGALGVHPGSVVNPQPADAPKAAAAQPEQAAKAGA